MKGTMIQLIDSQQKRERYYLQCLKQTKDECLECAMNSYKVNKGNTATSTGKEHGWNDVHFV